MSHPVLWPKKTFFYPIGNTAPVSLTQDLPLEERAELLLLGCGDPRHILYTMHTEEEIGRHYDFTCCDFEPGVLARNILLLTLVLDGHKSDVLWNIFYHLKVDQRSLEILSTQSLKLAQHSSSLAEWLSSPYPSILRFSSQSTMSRLQSYWQKYADSLKFTQKQQERYSATLTSKYSRITDKDSYLNFSVGRSAGPFWSSATPALSESVSRYWKTGIVQKDEKMAKAASFVNPTFIYTITGDSCEVHYGTYPLQAFHLAEAYTSIAEKDVSERHLTEIAMQQFKRWCDSFKTTATSGRCVLRFFAGDAVALCHALQHVRMTGSIRSSLYLSAWSGAELLLDGGDYSPGSSAPLTFNVIETSNILDHIGILNLFIAVTPLLKQHPSATLYTEALLVEEDTATQGFLRRLCAELPAISLILGIVPVACITGFSSATNVNEIIMSTILSASQYHERIGWKNTASSVIHTLPPPTIKFASEPLAKILFGIYHEMLKDLEDIKLRMSNMMSGPSNMKKTASSTSVIHYHRVTLVMLMALCKSRIQCDWESVMDHFLDLLEKKGQLILNSNYFQEVCVQLCIRGIYTVDVLRPTRYMEFLKPGTGVFSGWDSIPPIVCVVLTIPRERLKVLEDLDNGSPMLQCEIRGPGRTGSHNIFSGCQMAFGTVVTNGGVMKIEEDAAGLQGSSPLVVSAWVSSHALQRSGPQSTVGLGVYTTIHSLMSLQGRLGADLSIFAAHCMDRKHVLILPYRPNRPNELEDLRIPETSFQGTTVSASVNANLGISELTIRWDISEDRFLDMLPSAVIIQKQTSPSTLDLLMDSKPVYAFAFPFPVNGHSTRLRIARKSKYIEAVAPISWPPFRSEITTLNGRVLGLKTDNSPIPWSVHAVQLDRSPVMNKSALDGSLQLQPHLGSAFSFREKRLRDDKTSNDVLTQIKDSIHSFFIYTSQGRRLFQLNEPDNGGYTVIYVNDIKLDLSCHTFIADACVLPLTSPFLDRHMNIIGELVARKSTVIEAKMNEAIAWKHLLPTFVERCRTWSHKATCEYTKPGRRVPLSTDIAENPLCSCGEGVNLGNLSKDKAWATLRKYMTRMAISSLFPVSFLEPIIGNDSLSASSISKATENACAYCQKEKPSSELSSCSACKKVRYCGSKCQRADWKDHKKSCNK